MRLIFELKAQLKVCVVLLVLNFNVMASTQMTLEKAQQMYQENPTAENWDQLSALQTQASINEAYPYLLVGLIFLYVVMRMIFSNRIKKA
jgi:hypothetical protein